MLTTKIIGETLFFLIALPLMAFQTTEMLHALIDFVSDFTQHYK